METKEQPVLGKVTKGVGTYMFKMLNPKRFYHAVGTRKFLEFILLAAFILFFYGPMLNMLMLAFADEYSVPAVLPQAWGFKWWRYVFSQDNLVSSIAQSFIVAPSPALNIGGASCSCCRFC